MNNTASVCTPVSAVVGILLLLYKYCYKYIAATVVGEIVVLLLMCRYYFKCIAAIIVSNSNNRF